MSKFCMNCGNEIEDGTKFCMNCGAKVDDAEEQVTETPVANDDPFNMGPVPTPQDAPQPNFSQNEYYDAQNADGNVNVVNKPSMGLAIASMICGILSILCCCFSYFGIVLAIAALVMGIISVAQHKGGKGMAVAGIVCGAIGLIFSVTITIFAQIGSNSFTEDRAYEFMEEFLDDYIDDLDL